MLNLTKPFDQMVKSNLPTRLEMLIEPAAKVALARIHLAEARSRLEEAEAALVEADHASPRRRLPTRDDLRAVEAVAEPKLLGNGGGGRLDMSEDERYAIFLRVVGEHAGEGIAKSIFQRPHMPAGLKDYQLIKRFVRRALKEKKVKQQKVVVRDRRGHALPATRLFPDGGSPHPRKPKNAKLPVLDAGKLQSCYEALVTFVKAAGKTGTTRDAIRKTGPRGLRGWYVLGAVVDRAVKEKTIVRVVVDGRNSIGSATRTTRLFCPEFAP